MHVGYQPSWHEQFGRSSSKRTLFLDCPSQGACEAPGTSRLEETGTWIYLNTLLVQQLFLAVVINVR